MPKKIFFLLIFIIIVGAVLAYLYFVVELPSQQQIKSLVNISLAASTKYLPNTFIYTNFIITGQDNSFSYSGNTSDSGFTLVQLPANYTFLIENKNLNNQNYYTTPIIVNTTGVTNKQIKMILNTAGILSVVSNDNLNNNNSNFTIAITSNGFSQQINYCLRWSLHILDVTPLTNDKQIDVLPKYQNFDKCYSTGKDLENNVMNIPFNFSTFGLLDSSDYINISVVDQDFQNNKLVLGGQAVNIKIK